MPPRFWKSSIDLASGSSGGTCVRGWPFRRTTSIAALVRKTNTFKPAVRPPLAMVKATEDNSESIPLVIRITSLSVPGCIVVSSSVGWCVQRLPVGGDGETVFDRFAKSIDRKAGPDPGWPIDRRCPLGRAAHDPAVRLAAVLLHAQGRVADGGQARRGEPGG